MATNENAPEEFATEADKRLWLLIRGNNPRVDEVRAAITAGANVNSTDRFGESLLQEAVTNCSLEVLQSLLDAGADINHEEPEGSNALADAVILQNPETVAFLLRHGADPTAVLDKHESLLDWAEFDYFYHSLELKEDPASEVDRKACAAMTEIIALLKSAGAKRFFDIVAERPRKWLQVFAAYRTGLSTRDGMLDCDRLPNATEAFCHEFRAWKDSYFDTWPDKSFDEMPAGFDRAAHNAEGQRLAQEVKRMVGQVIEVEYLYLSAELEKKRVRNVLTQAIAGESR